MSDIPSIMSEDSKLMKQAIKYGSVTTVKILKRERGIPWDREMATEAIRSGSLDMVKCMMEYGCVFDSCEEAVKSRNGAMIKFLRGNCVEWGEDTMFWPASDGDLIVVEWLRNFDPPCPWDDDVFALAVGSGNKTLVEWMIENGCPQSPKACASAACHNNFKMLKFLREKNVDWDASTCADAAESGNLEILKWARENGCEWDERTCSGAAISGNLRMLKWARKNGCPWDKTTCSQGSIPSGNIPLLTWARRKGCEWDERCYIEAIISTEMKGADKICLFEWLRQNGCPYTTLVLREARAYGWGAWFESNFNWK